LGPCHWIAYLSQKDESQIPRRKVFKRTHLSCEKKKVENRRNPLEGEKKGGKGEGEQTEERWEGRGFSSCEGNEGRKSNGRVSGREPLKQ